jgi:hypothetical protein
MVRDDIARSYPPSFQCNGRRGNFVIHMDFLRHFDLSRGKRLILMTTLPGALSFFDDDFLPRLRLFRKKGTSVWKVFPNFGPPPSGVFVLPWSSFLQTRKEVKQEPSKEKYKHFRRKSLTLSVSFDRFLHLRTRLRTQ